MYHLQMTTTGVEIDAECDWDERPWDEDGFNSKDHPKRYAILREFEEDSMKLLSPDGEHNLEWFAKKWKITKFNKFGKSHCSAGYSDYLNPEKSYFGENPATHEKYLKWREELNDVQER